MKPPACRHCGNPRVNRPRGLCFTCFGRPGVRERYPSTAGRGHERGLYEDENPASLPLPEPTTEQPGTSAKVAVLCERSAAKQALWHPDDYIPEGEE